MSNEDDVGYKRPPAKNQFKPGKSGNPNGRPKKNSTDRDFAALHEASKVLNTKVKVTVNGRERHLHIIVATLLKLRRDLLTEKASIGSVREYFKLIKELEDLKVHVIKARGKSTTKVIRFVGADALV